MSVPKPFSGDDVTCIHKLHGVDSHTCLNRVWLSDVISAREWAKQEMLRNCPYPIRTELLRHFHQILDRAFDVSEKDGVMDSTGARVNDSPDVGSSPAPSNSQSLELHEEQTTDVKCCRTFQSGSSTSKDTLQSFKKVDEGHVAGFVQEHIGKSNSDKCLGDARHSSCDAESTTVLLDSSSGKDLVAQVDGVDGVRNSVESKSGRSPPPFTLSCRKHNVKKGDKMQSEYCANCNVEGKSCNCGIHRLTVRKGGV